MIRSAVWATGFAAVSLFAFAGLGVSTVASATQAAPASPAASTKIDETYVTFYGWYDNSPPGCAIAFGHCAGGTGTYADPITFASDQAEFPVKTIIYYPTVQKYFIMKDLCGECTADWSGPHGGPDGGPGMHHVDLWSGGKGGNEFDAIDCEDALTQGKPNGTPLLTPVMVNPPPNEPVSSEPIFNPKTNTCFGGETTTTSYGQYANGGSGGCVTDPGNSSTAGTAVDIAACTGGADQDLSFNGAFFKIDNLCLNAVEGPGTIGSPLDLASCTGGPGEQWSVNGNGTISSMQTALCVAQVGTAMQIANCTTAAAEQWAYTSEPAPASARS